EGPQADVGGERALHLRGERRVVGGLLDSAGGAARAAAAAAAGAAVARAGREGERESCGKCQCKCFHDVLLSWVKWTLGMGGLGSAGFLGSQAAIPRQSAATRRIFIPASAPARRCLGMHGARLVDRRPADLLLEPGPLAL